MRAVCLIAVCAIGIGAFQCAEQDGRDPFAMFQTFTHEEGLYSFRYLAPPWELENSEEDPDIQIIAVEPDAEDVDASIATGSIHARFKGVVSLLRHRSAKEALDADLETFSEIDDTDVEVTPFKSAAGRTGTHLFATLKDRNIRAVYFDSGDHTAAVMQIVGRESIEGADFTLLLKGLEPNGELE